jgi:hypothetical protein
MLDCKHRVWLLEMNARPSLNVDTLKDLAIKQGGLPSFAFVFVSSVCAAVPVAGWLGLVVSMLKLLSLLPKTEVPRAANAHSDVRGPRPLVRCAVHGMHGHRVRWAVCGGAGAGRQ